jgi:hypothetical protein
MTLLLMVSATIGMTQRSRSTPNFLAAGPGTS